MDTDRKGSDLPEAVWQDILGYVRVHYPRLVRGWFDALRPGALENGELEIVAANSAQQRYLDVHCLQAFIAAAQAATGHLVTVRFSSKQTPADATEDIWPVTQASTPLNPEYIFENFVVGPCNRLAHAASVAVSESPGTAYNPLFVHGDVGLGKTHLLQAICHAVASREPQAKILYLSCETFMNDFLEAVELGLLHSFRYRYRHVDVLVIDDVQFLADRERSQEEFFHTFNTLYQAQKQIVLSADSPPEEIPSLQERLVSRFKWGLVARIDAPCYETRMAIVRKKARLRGVDLPEEVVEYIASVVTTNTRELEGALQKTIGLSQAYGQPIDLALAQEALGESGTPRRRVTIQEIIERVSRHFGVRPADIQGKRRTKSITLPRQVCMYLARELTDHSLEEIGGYFGGRDHTTVIHACRTVAALREQDAAIRQTLDDLAQSLRRAR